MYVSVPSSSLIAQWLGSLSPQERQTIAVKDPPKNAEDWKRVFLGSDALVFSGVLAMLALVFGSVFSLVSFKVGLMMFAPLAMVSLIMATMALVVAKINVAEEQEQTNQWASELAQRSGLPAQEFKAAPATKWPADLNKVLKFEEEVTLCLDAGVDLTEVLAFVHEYGYVSRGCLGKLRMVQEARRENAKILSQERLKALAGVLKAPSQKNPLPLLSTETHVWDQGETRGSEKRVGA